MRSRSADASMSDLHHMLQFRRSPPLPGADQRLIQIDARWRFYSPLSFMVTDMVTDQLIVDVAKINPIPANPLIDYSLRAINRTHVLALLQQRPRHMHWKSKDS